MAGNIVATGGPDVVPSVDRVDLSASEIVFPVMRGMLARSGREHPPQKTA